MPTLTLQDLDNRVLSRLDENTLLYSQSARYSAINEAIRVLNLATGFLQATVPVPGWSQVNRHWYDVPQGLVMPVRVAFNGFYLGRTSINKLGLTHQNWIADTTANTGYQVYRWAPFGMKKFAIYPADSVGGGNIMVTGVAEPTVLTQPTQVVQFPTEVLTAFDALASHTLQLKESTQEFANSSLAYQEYLRQLKKITIWRGWVAPRFFIEEQQQPR